MSSTMLSKHSTSLLTSRTLPSKYQRAYPTHDQLFCSSRSNWQYCCDGGSHLSVTSKISSNRGCCESLVMVLLLGLVLVPLSAIGLMELGPLDMVSLRVWRGVRPARVICTGGVGYIVTAGQSFSREMWCFPSEQHSSALAFPCC